MHSVVCFVHRALGLAHEHDLQVAVDNAMLVLCLGAILLIWFKLPSFKDSFRVKDEVTWLVKWALFSFISFFALHLVVSSRGRTMA